MCPHCQHSLPALNFLLDSLPLHRFPLRGTITDIYGVSLLPGGSHSTQTPSRGGCRTGDPAQPRAEPKCPQGRVRGAKSPFPQDPPRLDPAWGFPRVQTALAQRQNSRNVSRDLPAPGSPLGPSRAPSCLHSPALKKEYFSILQPGSCRCKRQMLHPQEASPVPKRSTQSQGGTASLPSPPAFSPLQNNIVFQTKHTQHLSAPGEKPLPASVGREKTPLAQPSSPPTEFLPSAQGGPASQSSKNPRAHPRRRLSSSPEHCGCQGCQHPPPRLLLRVCRGISGCFPHFSMPCTAAELTPPRLWSVFKGAGN